MASRPASGVKYDLFGDSKHIFGLSFARYNAKVLEGITNSVTSQGNPTEIDYYAKSFMIGDGTPPAVTSGSTKPAVFPATTTGPASQTCRTWRCTA